MAKGKKQKPKKRVARRVDEDEQLHEGETGGDVEGDAEGQDPQADAAPNDGEQGDEDGAEDHGDADGETAEAPPEPVREVPAAAKSAKPAKSAKASKGKPVDAPPEMPITQHSDKGGVIFLSVVFGLLGLAILVGLLTK